MNVTYVSKEFLMGSGWLRKMKLCAAPLLPHSYNQQQPVASDKQNKCATSYLAKSTM